VLKNGMVVCMYGVCKSCVKETETQPGDQSHIKDSIEKALAMKYPELAQYLPQNYFEESKN
jgi:Fe-S cluster biogenesis protein NfuA